MNAYVFWPENCAASVVTVAMVEDGVRIFIRGNNDEVLAQIPVKCDDVHGIRQVFSQAFGDEVTE